MTQAKRRLHSVDATIAEAAALEEAQAAQAAAAKKELDEAAAQVSALMEAEDACLRKQAEFQMVKEKAAAEIESRRRALLEAKQAVIILEAEAARRNKQKAAQNLLQATKGAKGAGNRSVTKASDDGTTPTKTTSTASMQSPKTGTPVKAPAKGNKMPKSDTPVKAVASDQADTVPATLQDESGDIQ